MADTKKKISCFDFLEVKSRIPHAVTAGNKLHLLSALHTCAAFNIYLKYFVSFLIHHCSARGIAT